MKKLNKNGYVLLETIIVAVFIISIFTFIYITSIPLLGRYEDLAHSYDINAVYKLYHIRDAMYKDANYENIVKNRSDIIDQNKFSDQGYYTSLMDFLFTDEDNYKIIYVRKLRGYRSESAIDDLCESFNTAKGFKEYIKKIWNSQDNNLTEIENYIFLDDGGSYAYLGLAVNLNDPTNYKDPVAVVNDSNSHVDNSGANPPVMASGMIPVYFSSENGDNAWYKADITNKSDVYYWYDYNRFMWANVALVKNSTREEYYSAPLGTRVNDEDIIAFYVWIPRYEYFIDGTYGKDGANVNLPGEIEVNFIRKNITGINNHDDKDWRVATAFTFGSDELDGIWFAKFEMSSSDTKGYMYNNDYVPYIVPNVNPLTTSRDISIYNLYSHISEYMNGTKGDSIYGLSSDTYTVDSHMLKNNEWGAVAYLSQSKYGKYGNSDYTSIYKEIYINNRQNSSGVTYTGSSAGVPAKNSTSTTSRCSENANSSSSCFNYYVVGSIEKDGDVIPHVGVGASTTGTVYGVYDMSGGQAEVVMGLVYNTNTETLCGNTLAYSGDEANNNSSFRSGFKGYYYSYITQSSGQVNCNDTNGSNFPSDSKYYSLYFNRRSIQNLLVCGTSPSNRKDCFSEAMNETKGWYGNVYEAAYSNIPWYVRGGNIYSSSGIFAVHNFGATNGRDIAAATRPIIAIY